jgi:uncharacterized protein
MIIAFVVAQGFSPAFAALKGCATFAQAVSAVVADYAPLQHNFDSALLDGVEVITGDGLVAVPYYAWNNRGKGEMAVWIPYR